MKRPLLPLLALLALVAAGILFWPSDEPAPLDPPAQNPAASAEESGPVNPADLDPEVAELRELAEVFTGGSSASSGEVRNALRDSGPARLRAVDASGGLVRPALFLVRGQGGKLEWLEAPEGQLRFAGLQSVRAVAAFAGGAWSAPISLNHEHFADESLDLTVDQAAASLELRVGLAGVGPLPEARCHYEFRQSRPEAELTDFFNAGADADVVEFVASSDASGRGVDLSLFGDAFRVSRDTDPRGAVRDGVLEIDRLPPGHYQLRCWSETGVEQEQWITLAPGEHQSLEFALVEGGFVTGRVVDEKRAAVAQAQIGAQPLDQAFAELLGDRQLLERLERGTLDSRLRAESAADGSYRIGPLAPGRVLVAGLADDRLPARAGEVDIRAGQESRAPDLLLRAGHAVAILPRSAEDGEVLLEAKVRWRVAGDDLFVLFDDWTESSERDEAGRLIVHNLPFRTVELEVRCPDYAPQVQEYLMPERTWVADGEIPELEFSLMPGRVLQGIVLRPDGTPSPGAEVLVRSNDSEVNPLAALTELNNSDREAECDEEGRFVIEDLPAGIWVVLARDDTHAPGVSEAIDLEVQPRAEVTVQLQPAGSLTVRYIGPDGEPTGGRTVIVTELSLLVPATQTTDAQGEAHFPRLPAGDYQVSTVAAEGAQEGFERGEFDISFESFELAAGEQKEIEIGPGLAQSSVRGVVRDADGTPAGGLSVTLLGNGSIKTGRTDEDGRFHFEGLKPTVHSWFIGAGQATSQAGEILLAAGENELPIQLPGGGLEVRVLQAADGSPVAGVPVTVSANDTLGNPVIAMTDTDGLARVRYLDPGTYRVSAGAAAMPLFGSDDQLGAATADFAVGNSSMKLELRLQEASTFRIRALDLDGQPLAGATMFYLREDGQPLSSVSMKSTNSGGVAQLTGLPPGPGRILVKHPSGVQKEFAVDLPPGELSKQEVRMDPGVTVWLRVVDASGEPTSGVLATLVDQRGVRLSMLYSMQDASETNQAYIAGREQRLGPVAPGRYTVEVFRLGGKIVRQELTVPADASEIRRTVTYR